MNNVLSLNNKFSEISSKGWIKSQRAGYTGIGYTFEKLIGKEEENFEIPDYKGIEIKTKRNYSKSFITLFNATPEGENFFEIQRLYEKYGHMDIKNKKEKVLNNSVYANYIIDVGIQYKFSLKIDYNENRIYLLIFDRMGYLIEKKAYWTFEKLEEKLYRKLNYLAVIDASSKYINNEEYFKYNNIKFYKLKNFKTFLSLIEKGIIRITFKVSKYTSGNKIGKIHDHGTSFSIKDENLLLLYDEIKI